VRPLSTVSPAIAIEYAPMIAMIVFDRTPDGMPLACVNSRFMVHLLHPSIATASVSVGAAAPDSDCSSGHCSSFDSVSLC